MPPLPDERGRRHPVHHTPVEKDNRTTLIFLTICTKDRRPVLAHPDMQRVLVEWWKKADHWLVGKYIILPNHVHLFCAPGVSPQSLQSWIGYWKNGVARQRPGEKRNPFWQRDFWDTQLRSADSYEKKWEYVRHNPVRHKLIDSADAWPYQGEIHPFEWHDT